MALGSAAGRPPVRRELRLFQYLFLFFDGRRPLCLLFVLLEDVSFEPLSLSLQSLGVLRGMLGVPCRPRVETLEAWPIVCGRAHAARVATFPRGQRGSRRCRGHQAEITAEPKLAAAEAKMDVVTAGANLGQTGSRALASAKANACGPPPRPSLMLP